jgi:molybdopterin synthase sulfur carrier subunit
MDCGGTDGNYGMGLLFEILAVLAGAKNVKLEVVYFAWVRERIGVPRETVETEAETVAALVTELRAREDRYDLVFSDVSVVRVALDQTLSDFDAPLDGVSEVAFFPPMTGG